MLNCANPNLKTSYCGGSEDVSQGSLLLMRGTELLS
uniref:Uncharacterized protein n=1 Tax=Anguilla anguilla TaxID=7936 RepID=A0A0E9UVQ9_ANGAN